MYEIYEKLRNSKGVKDIDVSRATGIAQATLSNWKSGNYSPKADKLMKIADYFGVPVDTFIRCSDEQK